MEQEPLDALGRLIDALGAAARRWMREDPGARDVAKSVARWLTDSAADSVSAAVPTPEAGSPSEPPAPEPLREPMQTVALVERATLPPPAAPAPTPIGHPQVVSSSGQSWSGSEEAYGFNDRGPRDLALIARRSGLKAESCRVAIERRQHPGAESDLRGRRLIEQAKMTERCVLWPLFPQSASIDDASLELAAACYTTLGAMAASVNELAAAEQHESLLRESLHLLAECQSAVWGMSERLGLRTDADQIETFIWLREKSRDMQEYIARYLRETDIADPDAHEERGERVREFIERSSAVRNTEKERKRLRSKIRYEASRLSDAGADPVDSAMHWRTLHEAVEAIIELGVRPSDSELRAVLLPLVEVWPDVDGEWLNVERVLGEIDRYLATREGAELQPEAAEEPSAEVRQAREILRGRRVVMIGGECRPRSREKLERAFELEELVWITSREHQSIAPFESAVARGDTAMVILAIRWSSHSFEGVRKMCERHDKAFVRLPRGYGVNQVAREVVLQTGARLGTATVQ